MFYFAGAAMLGAYLALLAVFIGSGGSNGAAAVLLGGWGAAWVFLAGVLYERHRHEGDEYQDDAPPAPPRHLQPPTKHLVLTVRHESGQSLPVSNWQTVEHGK